MAQTSNNTTVHETSPLLANGHTNDNPRSDGAPAGESKPVGRWQRIATPELRLLIAGFIITTALCFTQVPIIYAFRKMACEEYYKHAEPYTGAGDRCSKPAIDAATTRQMMILGMSTIVCGILNLTITGMLIKSRGPHFALVVNTFFPVLRVSMQAVGVGVGAKTGIILMQCSQVLAIVGGPAGYLLTLNTSVAELVEASKRTASFGKLQGAAMFGTALGFLLGGIVGEATIIRRPFEITAGLLALCCLYCWFFVPYIDPKTMGGADKKDSKSKKSSSFLGVLGPQTLRLQDGRTVRYYGLSLLAFGGFVAGLAIGYAPVLTQMYSITVLSFTPTLNSAFMFMSFTVRGIYLMFVFPYIIKWGRRWFARSKEAADRGGATLIGTTPTEARDLGPIEALPEAEAAEPAGIPRPVDEDAGAAFDLWYLRWSMLGDALVTGCIGFASQKWHIFLAGALLPFFSGSDAASKGVITELVPAAQRPEALQAITLVGYSAALATVGIFGSIYSALAEIGQAYLTRFINAGAAVLAVLLLVFVSIPPKGSTIETGDEDTEPETPEQE
ncbi:putative Major facilitator superfamily (MFS) profile domain-containing protein [Seiridium cardinale]